MRLYFLILMVGWLGLVLRLQAADLADDFEESMLWEVKEWGDGAKLSLSPGHATQGQKALEVRLDPANKKPDNKGLFLRRGFSGRPENLQTIEVDIFNGLGKPIEFALAIEADEYYEGPKIKLQAGWNRDVRLDLLSQKFKSATSNWEYKTGLKKGAAVGNIFFIFYSGDTREGLFAVDNLRVKEWGNSLTRLRQKAPILKAPSGFKILESSATGKVGQRYEVTFNFEGFYHNPFDPDEIAVDGVFTAPSGRQLRMPGFLAKGEVTLKAAVTDALWKLRITPDEPGVWSFQVFVKNPRGSTQSVAQSFTVEKAPFRGFLQVDAKDPHYFSFGDGSFYYPMGQNVGWDSDDNYKKIFAAMGNSGQNWTRVWMSNWSFGLEWKEMGFFRGLGNYNLVNAERLDRLMDLAAQHGIFMQLVFDFHGALSSKVNAEWTNNPYNKANGGLLAKADDFWTDPQARELYKRRLRYIVARWGYSPQIMAWEFFNEINFSDNFAPEKETAWLKDMSAWLKDLDPHRHMITTSYYDYYNKKTYELPTIDYTQYHAYQKRVVKTMQTVVERFRQFNKPFFFAEFGGNSADGVDDADKKGVFVHAGLWSQAMQPTGGNAMPWWWNTHIAPNDLYYHWKALAQYLEGIDRRNKDWQTVREEWMVQRRLGLDEKLIFQGLQSTDLMLGWIADSRAFQAQDAGSLKEWRSLQFKVQVPKDGFFAVEYWDTIKGAVINRTELRSRDGRLYLTLPEFKSDIAFKVIRKKDPSSLAETR
ncbi:MAG TPA: DUF5060 domain-containing protein [Oligoflexus sp.]|uniref:DUF5060 domain-containing protein n=1 Tax=Oligoflexus sp. TaxID=1971216 RepID=UPI002D21F8BA|nr:DUF5060 domain-containing protein [Oligoflexus sp.]HYX36420.1 DUF5060 domain-containing protein [Oligoflexus sp.]